MIEELKPSILAEQGLAEALRLTVDLFSQRHELPVDLSLQLPEKIPPELELSIYRICQEALANIEKHAAAQHVILHLGLSGDKLHLAIKDDGKGFEPNNHAAGNGLLNMRQRADESEGAFEIISKAGLGTSIIACFPLKG